MSLISPERIIILVDMDCFYVQVEQKFAPEFKGRPCAVVQYNAWKGGGIIAVNYEARDLGVTRSMRGDLAKTKCPDLHLFQVPEERGKANLTKYRDAGAEVIKVLSQFSDIVERASIDEAFLDVTDIITQRMKKGEEINPSMLPNTYVVGFEPLTADKSREGAIAEWLNSSCKFNYIDKRLGLAGILAEEMREAVYNSTGYRCSAGIAHNKMLAKLTCGLHKPNRQTILPFSSIEFLYQSIPIHKVRSLGGKFGEEVKDKLKIEMMSDLAKFNEKELQKYFGEKHGTYLYNLAKGLETDPVTSKLLAKSIGCGKNFPGKTALAQRNDVVKWLTLLMQELEERLHNDRERNQRMAQLLTISIKKLGDNSGTFSKSCPLHSYDAAKLSLDALKILEKLNTGSSNPDVWSPPIINLSLSAGKFQDNFMTSTKNIASYFSKGSLEKEDKSNADIKGKVDPENEDSCQSISRINIDEISDKEIKSPKKTNIKSFFVMKKIEGSVKSPPKCSSNLKTNGSLNETVKPPSCLANFYLSSENTSDTSNSPKKSFFALKMETSLKVQETTKSTANFDLTSENDSSDMSNSPKKGFFAMKMAKNMRRAQGEVPDDDSLSRNFYSGESSCDKTNTPKKTVSSAKTDNEEVPCCSKDIQRVFDNKSEAKPSNVPVNDEFYNCEECHRRIFLFEVEDHLDFHYAQKVQKEIRAETMSAKTTPVKTSPKNVKRKLKPRNKDSKKSKKEHPNRTLDFYLKR